jgi:hypothetical protein
MVKLLRCVADVTQSSTEIKARFDEPLIIKANSKIALLNCRTRFPSMEAEGSFTIVDGTTGGVANNIFTVDNQQVAIPAGTYSISELEDLMEVLIAQNCGVAQSSWILTFVGTDYRLDFGDGKFNLTKTATRSENALWSSGANEYWFVEAGDPDLTTVGTFISDAGADTNNPDIVYSTYHIPNAAFGCSATVTAVAAGINKPWELGAYEDSLSTRVYSIGTNSAGNYVYYHFSNTAQPFTDGSAAPTTTPQAGDQIRIFRTGDTVGYAVRRAGVDILSASEPVDFEDQRRAFLTRFPIAQVISRNDGLTLTQVKFTILEPEFNSKLRSFPTSVSISFATSVLSKYLGFTGTGPFTQAGDPAVLVSQNLLDPDEKAVGILLTIDPLVLESYDGDIRPKSKKGRDSILAVLNQEDSLGKTFVLDVNFPVALDIKNARDYTLNQFSLRFKDSANGEILVFDKDTVVTLVIYGPDESP